MKTPRRMMVLRQSVSLVALLAVLGCSAQPDPNEVFEREVSNDTSEQIIDSLILAAEASERSGDWGGAAQYWGNLLGKDPTNRYYALGLGTALRRLSQFGESVQVFRDALPYNPDDPELLAAYGKSLLAAGYQTDAIAELQKAAAIAPSDWRVQSALGVAYGMGGQIGLADQHYRQALVLSPGNPTVLSNYGLHKAVNGDMNTALLLLAEAYESLDATLQVRQNYALLLVLSGDMAAAEAIVRSDLIPEAADRQLAFFESMRGEDLDNLENFMGQGTSVVEEEALLPAAEAGSVVNLTNLEEDPDAFLSEPEDVVVVEPVELALPEPGVVEDDPIETEVLAAAADPELEVQTQAVPEIEAEPVPPEGFDAEAPDTAMAEPMIGLIPDADEELLVIVPQETAQPLPEPEVDVSGAALPTPPLQSTLVIEPGDESVVVAPAPEAVADMVADQRFYRVQLAAVGSETAALDGRDRFSRDLENVLGGADVIVQPGAVSNGAATWRILAGAYASSADAEALCAAIKSGGGDCYVRRDEAVVP